VTLFLLISWYLENINKVIFYTHNTLFHIVARHISASVFSPKRFVVDIKLWRSHHSRRGNASPVLTATSFVKWKWQISTPLQNRYPLTDRQKFVTGDLVGDHYTCAISGANPPTGVFCVNITIFAYLFILLFGNSHIGQKRLQTVALDDSNDADLTYAMVYFWGTGWHCSSFKGTNPPKTSILGAWISIFKPNTQNIKTCILRKLLDWFQPNFAKCWRPPNIFCEWSRLNTREINPRWRTASILKNVGGRNLPFPVDKASRR